MTECDLRVVTDEATLGALQPDWDALYQKTVQRSYSQSFDWCWQGWLNVAKPRGGKLHCLIATADRRLILVWPLVIRRNRLWLVARPLGSETTEYASALIEDGPEAASWLDLAWQALRQESPYDVLRLPFVRDGSPLHRLIATKPGFGVTEEFATSTVDWMASADWESYYRRLDRQQRHAIARRRRRLAEAGKVTFIAEVDVDRRSSVIDWIVEQKRQWLVRTARKNDWLGTDEYRRFLIAVAERANLGDRVIVSALQLDGTIIAASLKRVGGLRIEFFLDAYDPSYRMFSPSHILHEDSLKWCFERGLEVDLRIGNESYKEHWHLRKSTATTHEFSTSPWGTAFVLLKRVRQRYKFMKTTLSRQYTADPAATHQAPRDAA